MKIKGNSYFLIFIMAITLFVIAWSLLAMEYYESKLLPVIIGSAVFILAAVLLRRDISAKGESEATPDGDGEGTDKPVEPLSGYLRQGAWVGGFVLAVYLLGFIVAVPFFILFYMKHLGARWRTAITFTIIFPSIIYGLFEFALGIEMYRGLLFGWLGY